MRGVFAGYGVRALYVVVRVEDKEFYEELVFDVSEFEAEASVAFEVEVSGGVQRNKIVYYVVHNFP